MTMADIKDQVHTIVPLYPWDSKPWQQAMAITFIMKFEDVLDPARLENALIRLVELKNWRKLGARIRRRPDKKLEYVIPASFTKERPGVAFSHQSFEIGINEHPLASKLPKSTGPTESFEDSVRFDSIAMSSGAPTKLEDWIRNEIPQLVVHVTSFQDATLINLRWCHTLWDASGRADFLRAWTAVLEGREEDVPELTGFDQDPLSSITASEEASKRHVLYDQILTGLGFVLFVIFFMIEQLLHPKHESRVVRIDHDTFANLYARAKLKIALQSENGAGVFVSESDVLLAWWVKVLLFAHKVPTSRPVNVQNAMAFRHLLPDCFPTNQAYIGNSVYAATTQFATAREVVTSATAQTALRLRQSLQQQAKTDQIRAAISCNQRRTASLLKPWNAFLVMLSNWHKARHYESDFSAAVIKVGTPLERRNNGKGKPSLVTNYAYCHGQRTMRNAGAVTGKDPNGNWWITWTVRKGVWDEIDAILQKEVSSLSTQA